MRAFVPLLLFGLIAAGVLYFRRATVPRLVPASAGPLPSLPSSDTATTPAGSMDPSLDELDVELSSESTAEEPLPAGAPAPGVSDALGGLDSTGASDATDTAGASSTARRVTREATIEERSEELVEELVEDLELDPTTMGALAELLEERLLWRAEASVAPPTNDERRAKDVALEASLVELYGDDVGQEVLQLVLSGDL